MRLVATADVSCRVTIGHEHAEGDIMPSYPCLEFRQAARWLGKLDVKMFRPEVRSTTPRRRQQALRK